MQSEGPAALLLPATQRSAEQQGMAYSSQNGQMLEQFCCLAWYCACSVIRYMSRPMVWRSSYAGPYIYQGLEPQTCSSMPKYSIFYSTKEIVRLSLLLILADLYIHDEILKVSCFHPSCTFTAMFPPLTPTKANAFANSSLPSNNPAKTRALISEHWASIMLKM
jgi:hypothetical protein